MLEKTSLRLVVCVVGVSLVGCHRHSTTSDTHGVGLAAFEGGAVVVSASASTHRFFLQRYDDDGSQRWHNDLACAVSPLLAASAAEVVVSCKTEKDVSISAYDLRDGHEAWHYTSKHVTGAAMQPRFVAGSVVVTGDDGILVLDPSTGRLRLEYPTKMPARGGSIDGARIAYGLSPRVLVIDTATGQQGAVEREGFGCLGHGKLWSAENGKLLMSDAGDLGSAPAHVELDGVVSSVVGCGSYDRDSVLEVTVASSSVADHVVRVSEQGHVVWDVKLGEKVIAQPRSYTEWREASGLNGELPRFSLVLAQGHDGARIGVIDLEDGSIRPIEPALSERAAVALAMMRSNGYWYVTNSDHLQIVDGSSGRIVGDSRFDADQFIPLTPTALTKRGVWMLSTAWGNDTRVGLFAPDLKKVSGNASL